MQPWLLNNNGIARLTWIQSVGKASPKPIYNGPILSAQLSHAGPMPSIHVGLTVGTSLHSNAYNNNYTQSMQIKCYQSCR